MNQTPPPPQKKYFTLRKARVTASTYDMRGRSVVSVLASGARGPRFDPRS